MSEDAVCLALVREIPLALVRKMMSVVMQRAGTLCIECKSSSLSLDFLCDKSFPATADLFFLFSGAGLVVGSPRALPLCSRGTCGGTNCFWIDNINDTSGEAPEIMIAGTTGVEIVSGLHWYLKYWCGAHISWDKTGGAQLSSVPQLGSLPRVQNGGIIVRRSVPFSYYQNVVTYSYSFVWWDWTRWEKEIDWMALQGVNLPLAFTGQEAIWQKVFKIFNLSKHDLDDFFGGPAFLAWARMGNLHGWGGPLSENWLNQQLALQKCILARMVNLGMTPVLPSFSGNVPKALKRQFPSANISRLGNWNTVDGDRRWCCTFLLDPSDPLFVKIGKKFIQQQIQEYGDVTDIYSCDTFNENSPPSSDPTYISSLGAAIYHSMCEGDKDAIWLMQGWLFSSDPKFWKPAQMKALLHSVPFGKMIVIDLFADVIPLWERSGHFYGTPYVWCMLHNFGGNIEMYGTLNEISSGPIDAYRSQNSHMVGVGMCMEGIEQNPIVYELMSEMSFRGEKVILEEWVKSYARRRYGKAVVECETTWKILLRTVYNCTDGTADHNRDFIVHFPDMNPSTMSIDVRVQTQNPTLQRWHRSLALQETSSSSNMPVPHLWYPTTEVVHALKLFINAGDYLRGSLTYRYDLVDLARQVLSKLANQVYLDALIAFQQKNQSSLALHSQRFIDLINDIDTLLASDDNFLLGTWLKNAKQLAVNQMEMKQYEWNARTQVTMWFDNTNTKLSKLHDYANKFWSGLLKMYYLPRASIFFIYLSKCLYHNETFYMEKWRREWISYSNSWQAGREIYPVKAIGYCLFCCLG